MGEGEAMKAQVSALMDGELDERESMETLRALCGDAELRRRWADYHRIAASLRGEPEPDLVARVMTAIDAESTPPCATSQTILDRLLFLARRCVDFGRAPAWALAASLAGIAVVIAWTMSSAPAPGERPGVLQARVEIPPALLSPPSSHPSSASLQEYLLAHQAYAPGGALTGGARDVRGMHRVAASGGGR